MKNRAKCKLCNDIVESVHSQDYQLCRCGEIFVDGGKLNYCGARDWVNFVRIDDNGKEHAPQVVDKTFENSGDNYTELPPPTRQDKLEMLKDLIAGYDRLPPVAHGQSVTHYDMKSALMIIYGILND